MTQTTIRLKFVDVLGNALDDHSVVADIFDQHNINHYQVTIPLNGETNAAINLQDAPGGVYRFELSPTNYQVIQFFLTLPPGGTVIRKKPVVFPVDPGRVTNISAPDFRQLDQKLQKFLNASSIALNGTDALSGEALYNSLPPRLKAALLNFFVKSSKTTLGQKTCFDFLASHSMVEQDQDRMFAKIDGSLVEETGSSPDFRTADFSLHKDIPPYKRFASFKTPDAEGNLQLTFSRNGTIGNDYLVDLDIDEAEGIKHLFEVLHNAVTGKLTDPYNIREILMAAQGIKPLYTFQFPQKKVARIAKAVGSRG